MFARSYTWHGWPWAAPERPRVKARIATSLMWHADCSTFAAQSAGRFRVLFEVTMSRLISRQVRWVALLAVAATLAMTSLPALAQTESMGGDCSAIQFEMANPAPGSRVDPGTYIVQGIALDTRAEDGPGIDRIDFFLGNREQGGVLLGHAVVGAADSFGPFGPNSFQTRISVPNVVGGRDIFGYAHSTVTGQENVIAVPIAVGVDPTTLANKMAAPDRVTCMATPPPADLSDAPMAQPEMSADEPQVQPGEAAPA